MRGKVRAIKTDRGFAFIRGEDQQDYFFHRNTNPEVFDEMLIGHKVTFEGVPSARGLRAEQVERA